MQVSCQLHAPVVLLPEELPRAVNRQEVGGLKILTAGNRRKLPPAAGNRSPVPRVPSRYSRTLLGRHANYNAANICAGRTHSTYHSKQILKMDTDGLVETLETICGSANCSNFMRHNHLIVYASFFYHENGGNICLRNGFICRAHGDCLQSPVTSVFLSCSRP
jgi:hypothetical protein